MPSFRFNCAAALPEARQRPRVELAQPISVSSVIAQTESKLVVFLGIFHKKCENRCVHRVNQGFFDPRGNKKVYGLFPISKSAIWRFLK